eukprot:gene691-8943_t
MPLSVSSCSNDSKTTLRSLESAIEDDATSKPKERKKKEIDLSFLNEPGPTKKSPKSPTLAFFSKLTKSPTLGTKKSTKIKKTKKKKNENENENREQPMYVKGIDIERAMDDVYNVTETLYTEHGEDSEDDDEPEDEGDIRGVKTESFDSFYDHPDILKYLETSPVQISALNSPPKLEKFHQKLDAQNKGINVNYDSENVKVTPVVVPDLEENTYTRNVDELKSVASSTASMDENTIVIDV